MSNRKFPTLLLALTTAFILGTAAFWLLRPSPTPLPPLPPVTIAAPPQLSAPVLVASAQGLFQRAGVEVIHQPFDLGRDALKSVLDGKADLAVVADTPFIFALAAGNDIGILAEILNSRRYLAIVARTDRGITGLQDLAGKSVALSPGTNLPYYLDAILQTNRIPIDAVNRVLLNTSEVISAFKQGQVDAALVFHPFLAQLQAEMGESVKVFYGDTFFSNRMVLVGKAGYIDSHPQEVQRVLRALLAANQSMAADPVAARHIVGAAIKMDDAIMARFFDPSEFSLSLSQTMLLALDDQTRWAMAQGLVKPGPVPNYLKFIKYQHLEAIMPEAVQLVR